MINQGIALLRILIPREQESQSTANELMVLLVARALLLDAMGRTDESREVFLEAEALIEDQKEIIFLNQAFVIAVYLADLDRAHSIAEVLRSRSFRQRDFWELCVEHGFADCREDAS